MPSSKSERAITDRRDVLSKLVATNPRLTPVDGSKRGVTRPGLVNLVGKSYSDLGTIGHGGLVKRFAMQPIVPVLEYESLFKKIIDQIDDTDHSHPMEYLNLRSNVITELKLLNWQNDYTRESIQQFAALFVKHIAEYHLMSTAFQAAILEYLQLQAFKWMDTFVDETATMKFSLFAGSILSASGRDILIRKELKDYLMSQAGIYLLPDSMVGYTEFLPLGSFTVENAFNLKTVLSDTSTGADASDFFAAATAGTTLHQHGLSFLYDDLFNTSPEAMSMQNFVEALRVLTARTPVGQELQGFEDSLNTFFSPHPVMSGGSPDVEIGFEPRIGSHKYSSWYHSQYRMATSSSADYGRLDPVWAKVNFLLKILSKGIRAKFGTTILNANSAFHQVAQELGIDLGLTRLEDGEEYFYKRGLIDGEDFMKSNCQYLDFKSNPVVMLDAFKPVPIETFSRTNLPTYNLDKHGVWIDGLSRPIHVPTVTKDAFRAQHGISDATYLEFGPNITLETQLLLSPYSESARHSFAVRTSVGSPQLIDTAVDGLGWLASFADLDETAVKVPYVYNRSARLAQIMEQVLRRDGSPTFGDEQTIVDFVSALKLVEPMDANGVSFTNLEDGFATMAPVFTFPAANPLDPYQAGWWRVIQLGEGASFRPDEVWYTFLKYGAGFAGVRPILNALNAVQSDPDDADSKATAFTGADLAGTYQLLGGGTPLLPVDGSGNAIPLNTFRHNDRGLFTLFVGRDAASNPVLHYTQPGYDRIPGSGRGLTVLRNPVAHPVSGLAKSADENFGFGDLWVPSVIDWDRSTHFWDSFAPLPVKLYSALETRLLPHEDLNWSGDVTLLDSWVADLSRPAPTLWKGVITVVHPEGFRFPIVMPAGTIALETVKLGSTLLIDIVNWAFADSATFKSYRALPNEYENALKAVTQFWLRDAPDNPTSFATIWANRRNPHLLGFYQYLPFFRAGATGNQVFSSRELFFTVTTEPAFSSAVAQVPSSKKGSLSDNQSQLLKDSFIRQVERGAPKQAENRDRGHMSLADRNPKQQGGSSRGGSGSKTWRDRKAPSRSGKDKPFDTDSKGSFKTSETADFANLDAKPIISDEAAALPGAKDWKGQSVEKTSGKIFDKMKRK